MEVGGNQIKRLLRPNKMFKVKDNKFIIVAYHYIRDPGPGEEGIKACSVKRFGEQVRDLLKFYKIVPLEELYARVRSRESGFYCTLTFEDGFADHYLNALPILKKFKVSGTFFPVTMTLEGKIPLTQKVHILLSKKSIIELVKAYEEFMKKVFPRLARKYFIPRDRLLKKTRIFDDMLTANFKEIITRLPIKIKTKFIDRYFRNLPIEEDKLCKDLFMNRNQLKKLRESGMSIGSQTHTHISLKTLDLNGQKREIKKSKKILEDILGQKVNLFSYPFGDHTAATIKILKQGGFRLAVTNEPRSLTPQDNCFELPRYDVNHLRNMIP